LINKANGEFPNVLAINSFLQATSHDLQVDAGFSAREIISLGLKFRSVASTSLATEVLPTYGTQIDGNDVLIAAQPYAQTMSELPRVRLISSQGLVNAHVRHSDNPAGHGHLGSERDHDHYPESQVVLDTPRTWPEPWNPKPC